MKKLMKNGALLALLAITALTSAASAAPAAKPKAKLPWNSTMKSALALAKKSGKPIFVDFYTTWCEPCKLMEKDVFTDKAFIRESKKWILVKLDAEKGKANVDLATKLKVKYFPTLMFVKPNGKEAGRVEGFYPANILVRKMKQGGVKALGGRSF